MNKTTLLCFFVLTLFTFGAVSSLAQPAVTSRYRQTKANISAMEHEYQNDPRGFRARWFPKLDIPLKRKDYFGVWNYFNHGTHPVKTVYDYDKSKRTYYYKYSDTHYLGHNGVDWLVSYRNYEEPGANKLINPFPQDAVVFVTQADDSHPDIQDDNRLGNSLTLSCYLDRNPNNKAPINVLMVKFSHLKEGSIVVEVGDQVYAHQELARVGISGGTELKVIHTHVNYTHMAVHLDPFLGPANPHLVASMFKEQAEVERFTNWKFQENQNHLTLNKQFYVTMPNRQTNLYQFRAAEAIAAIRVIDQNGNIVPDVNILENPNIRNLLFRQELFTAPGGFRRNVYLVSFNWYQNADPGTLHREIPFLVETVKGELSNRVFVKITEE